MTPFKRFEYLEIDDRKPRAPVLRPPPRAPKQVQVEEPAVGEQTLVVDQIIGRRGSGIGEFNCPAGLAVDGEGTLYVADSYNHRVQRITRDGRAMALGSKGAADGKFLNPQDIAIDHNFSIYVLEQGNSRIQKVSFDGHLERVIGGRGSRPGQFNSPMGLAIDRHGCMFVADTGNGRLQKLSAVGTPIYVVSSRLDRQLFGPQGVEVDLMGNCFVADTFSHCIVKFDPNGREVGKFGCRGDSVGSFDEPQDLAVDSGGRLYVIEMANHRAQVFSPDYTHIACVDTERSAGKLKLPTGIALGPAGELYISDTMNHRVLRLAWR